MAIQIELFSAPGCRRCAHAQQLVRQLVQEMGSERIGLRVADVVEELDYAVELGVLATPAIAIDGELVFSGVPTPRRLRAELERRLRRSTDTARGQT